MLRTRRLSLCTFLSVAALGCAADAPDSQVAAQPATEQGARERGLLVTPVEGDATRAAVEVVGAAPSADAVPAADAVPPADAAGGHAAARDGGYVVTVPGLPPFTVGSGHEGGPRVVDVDRTDLSQGDAEPPSGPGPRVIDVTRTDLSQGADDRSGDDDDGTTTASDDGEVVVKQRKDATIITVAGFPPITLTPTASGEILVTVPGFPPLTIPKGTVIEAPGGIRIEG